MGIAQSVMLLVTLLFVLTTRGVNLDYSASARAGNGAGLPSPILSPHTRRASSAFPLPEKVEPQPIPDPINEDRKWKPSWGALDRIKRTTHSAPATPAGLIRIRDSTRASSLSRYQTASDEEDMTHSDLDYTELQLRIGQGSDDEFLETLPEGRFLATDYPTPPNHGEMYK
jgi:hypothetical protein